MMPARRRLARGATGALLALALAAGPAAAQAPGEEGRATEDYHRAFLALAAGREAEAVRLLEQVVRAHPGDPLAAEAAERLEELGAERTAGGDTERAGSDRRKASRLGRAELVSGMTLNGIGAGVLTCFALECSGAREHTASMMIGGGLGLGLSLLATRGGITRGTGQLLNSSVVWGLWNGLPALPGAGGEQERGVVLLGAQGAGLGAGLLLDRTWRPTPGDIALTNTSGFWTSILVLLGHGVAGAEPELETLVGAGDAGLAAGALLSTQVDMSRGRTLLLDIGGILGFLSGGLVAFAIESDGDDSEAVFLPMMIGTAGGLGLATYWTRDWDAPEPDAAPRLGLVPIGRDGWGAGVTLTLP